MIERYEEKHAEAVDSDEEDDLIILFKQELTRLSKDPAFQIAALFQSEEIGYLYSENDEIEEALTEVIHGIDIRKKTRVLELDAAPGL